MGRGRARAPLFTIEIRRIRAKCGASSATLASTAGWLVTSSTKGSTPGASPSSATDRGVRQPAITANPLPPSLRASALPKPVSHPVMSTAWSPGGVRILSAITRRFSAHSPAQAPATIARASRPLAIKIHP